MRASAFAAKFREHFFEWRQTLRIDQAQQAELKMQAGVGLAPDVIFRRKKDLKKSRKIFFAELPGLLPEPRPFVVSRRD